MAFPKISIITPSFNQAHYLEFTIKSILDQNYPNLEYIIIDGGSTDGSVDIIKKYEKHLAYWISEPDQGLYFALHKGLSKSTGEIMGWLNSDDMLHKLSLFTLADIFSNIAQVNWVQGLPTIFDEMGRTTYTTQPPLKSKYNYYLKDYRKTPFAFIQQESTYWRRSLWEAAGGYISQEYRLAGDFELWMRFFQKDTLYFTQALIGGFRVRKENQLSRNNFSEYLSEVGTIINKIELSEEDKKVLRSIKLYRKCTHYIPLLKLNTYLHDSYQALFEVPPLIRFDTDKQQFII
ncbi:glycosyltransferase [Rhodocytophaga rosea]|uniref:Glycosyltransferase n=1 Tax=Rhodocytophaga rosea TaxID=2704465 RepID=A0A6C0GPP6_9BACT|nr:glycosyltransferase family 2 protein [Rhodocytophaga rosea]QHT69590.1 glycosyltransferase [Rhodocytophaga rosea]